MRGLQESAKYRVFKFLIKNHLHCAFSCIDFAPVALESSSHVARRSSSRASATSFTLISFVDVLSLPGFGLLSMLT